MENTKKVIHIKLNYKYILLKYIIYYEYNILYINMIVLMLYINLFLYTLYYYY